jgi:hypothetical protein
MHSRQGRRSPGDGSLTNPFELTPSFGSYAGSTNSASGFNRSPAGFGQGPQSLGGFNSINSVAIGGRQSAGAPLFPNFGATGQFAAAPFALPSLSQMMRGSFNLPLSSSSSNFRFTYQDALRPGGTFGDLGHPNASAMFTTSDLGNGVFLSAGTGYGIRSTAGAPAASLGNEAGTKHSGTAVNLKLSF